MLKLRVILLCLFAPVLYLVSVVYLGIFLGGKIKSRPVLSCQEAARVMDAASRSNGVHWRKVDCASVKNLGSDQYEAKMLIDDGAGTVREWTIGLTLDQYIITNAIQTGSHAVPKS